MGTEEQGGQKAASTVVEKKGALDHAIVLVERDPSLAPDDIEKFSAISRIASVTS